MPESVLWSSLWGLSHQACLSWRFLLHFLCQGLYLLSTKLIFLSLLICVQGMRQFPRKGCECSIKLRAKPRNEVAAFWVLLMIESSFNTWQFYLHSSSVRSKRKFLPSDFLFLMEDDYLKGEKNIMVAWCSVVENKWNLTLQVVASLKTLLFDPKGRQPLGKLPAYPLLPLTWQYHCIENCSVGYEPQTNGLWLLSNCIHCYTTLEAIINPEMHATQADLVWLHRLYLKIVFWVTKKRTPQSQLWSNDCIGWCHAVLLELLSLHPSVWLHNAGGNLCPLCQVWLTLANKIQNRQGGTTPLQEFVFLSKTKKGKSLILMQRGSTN